MLTSLLFGVVLVSRRLDAKDLLCVCLHRVPHSHTTGRESSLTHQPHQQDSHCFYKHLALLFGRITSGSRIRSAGSERITVPQHLCHLALCGDTEALEAAQGPSQAAATPSVPVLRVQRLL